MTVSYSQLDDLPFYSLKQFKKMHSISHNRSPISLYRHRQSKQILVVKEVPYRQQSQKIYKILLQKPASQSLVTIRGITLMNIKYENKKNYELQSHVFRPGLHFDETGVKHKMKNHKNNLSLLIFMEQCQCNLKVYVENRLKQRKPFKLNQVNDFLVQMLMILTILQEDNISHRDIKPQNILYDHGKYRLCDFDDSIYLNPLTMAHKRGQLDITTIAYTSPELFKNLKEKKKKLFDPFKLDVYALGLTLLYMCSLGTFNLKQREQYLKSQFFHNVHYNYIKEKRKKHIKNNPQLKQLNSIAKMMLEEDEYKRDTFITLTQKIKPMIRGNMVQKSESNWNDKVSQNSRSEESLQHKKKKKHKARWPGTTQLQRKSLQSLIIFSFSFFILLFIV